MIKHNRWSNRPEYEAAALSVLRSGHVAQGHEVEMFERELTERFRPDGDCAVVSSGTAALYMALKIRGEGGRGRSPVSIPTYACKSLYSAADLYLNCMKDNPYDTQIYDVCPNTYADVNATIVVHPYGVPVAVPSDSISDFTHAPGATLNNVSVGALGAFSVCSFGATKPLGIGMGGAVFGSKEAIQEIKSIRDYDSSDRTDAFNLQLGDIYAAIGRERLKRLDEENDRREEIAGQYIGAFVAPRGVRMVHGSEFVDTGRTWYRFVVRVPGVSAAIAHFASHDIQVINPLLPEELLHRRLRLDPSKFPNAEEIARSTISLPIWPSISASEVGRVAEALERLGE